MTETVVLERYRLIERIGRGGYGEVFRADDLLMGREVAVKRIVSSSKTGPRTLNEARAAGKLNHPNVVTVYDLEEDDDYFYLIMEYIDGVTLARAMEAKSPLAIEESLDVAIQIADALEAAHAMGIIHRDIKPDNVLITKDGCVKVTDFGIARLATSTLTNDGDILGTLSYMSPEQAKGGRIDVRSDVFSLGIVLYEMLTGSHPFGSATPAGTVFKITNVEPQPPSEINESISLDLESLVMRALDKKRTQRIADVTIFRHYLESLRSAKIPSRKVIKALYKQAVSDRLAPVAEYSGPFKPVVDRLSNAKERAGEFIAAHRPLVERVVNALLAMIMLSFFMSKTGFYAEELTAIIPYAYCALAIVFPRLGLAGGFLILLLPIADYSLVITVFAGIVVFLGLLSFWLVRPSKTVFTVAAPLTSMAGFGLAFPLVSGLWWKPLWAAAAAFLGCFMVEFFDLFTGKTMNYMALANSFGLKERLSGAINPLTAFPALIKPFIASPGLLLQPLLWASAAFLISVLTKRKSVKRDLYGLFAGAAVLLIGQFALMGAFGWNPGYIDSLLKTFTASFILAIGLLVILPRRSFTDDEDEEDFEEDDS